MIFQNRNGDKKIIVEKNSVDKDNHIPGEPNIFMRNKKWLKVNNIPKYFYLKGYGRKEISRC